MVIKRMSSLLSWPVVLTLFDRPKDHEELFNLRHAEARNLIEKIFGIFKRRFQLMNKAPEYPLQTQAAFVPALAALHNFIRKHDPNDNGEDLGADMVWLGSTGQGSGPQNDEVTGTSVNGTEEIREEDLGTGITPAEREQAIKRRDNIAKAMWVDYLHVRHERGLPPP